MRVKARTRWRIGLSIAAACVLLGAAASCWRGMFVNRRSADYRELDVTLTRAALHVSYADRSSRAPFMSRVWQPGWDCRVEPVGGTPRVEWSPSVVWQTGSVPGWYVRAPWWIPVLPLGIPGALLWYRHLRRAAHVCAACGYDLSGLSSGVCPECGTNTHDAEPVRS